MSATMEIVLQEERDLNTRVLDLSNAVCLVVEHAKDNRSIRTMRIDDGTQLPDPLEKATGIPVIHLEVGATLRVVKKDQESSSETDDAVLTKPGEA